MNAPDPYLEDIEPVLSVIDVRTERALVLLGEPIREVDEEDEEPSFPEWINQPPETAREGGDTR